MTNRLVEFLYRVYSRSVKSSQNSTKKSLVIFKINVNELKQSDDETLYSMILLYEEYFKLALKI